MATQAIDILIKARDEASKKFGAVGNAANSMAGILKTAAVGIAGYFSARAIIGFARESVQAFMEQQNAVAGLEAALDLLGKKTESIDLQNFASEIQRVTTVGDETTLAIMKLGASMGNLSGDALKKATLAAIGLSKAYGMDLNTAMTLIAKAAQGNTAAMSRYGIVFEESMTAQEKFNRVLDVGIGKFGIASAETQTLSGRLKQLSNAWGDVKEQIGQSIATSSIFQNYVNYAVLAMQNFNLSMDLVVKQIKLRLLDIGNEFKYTFKYLIPHYVNLLNDKSLIFDAVKKSLQSGDSSVSGMMKSYFDAIADKEKPDKYISQAQKILMQQIAETEKKLAEGMRQSWEKQINFNFSNAALPPSVMQDKRVLDRVGGISPIEARFLTGAGNVQDYDKFSFDVNRKQLSTQEKMVRLLERYLSNQKPAVSPQYNLQISAVP